AIKEAGEINDFAHNKSNIDYTKFVGGIYSSEWFWAKILHILRTNEDIRKDAYSWVEHTDWIPALLTGNTHPEKLKRFRCAAGHKGMWNEEFNGLPPNDFFKSIDPLLDGISDRIGSDTVTAEKPVGKISEEWASKLGLSPNVIIGGAAFDCHFGAVGGGISAYDMVKVIGTSTCDIVVAPKDEFGDKLISGICGQVDGSVIPDMIGLEAGQSAFGDAYAWFKNIILDPAVKLINNSSILSESVKNNLIKEFSNSLIPLLTSEAQKLPVESSIIALDWINGRRTPDANQELTAGFMGLNISTTAYQMFKAVIDATAFGARSIQDRFTDHGVEIKRIIAIGGVSRKSPLVMQTLSDVLNREIIVCASDQACALGSCMFAAVAAGIYPSVEDASSAMSSGYDITYKPIPENVKIYKELYAKYKTFGTFIESQTGGN
ncbi:MAG: ribulokinase, partial [Spirochaetales bacterium]|nr:ribulokinase [Spirochaetales bacterium]